LDREGRLEEKAPEELKAAEYLKLFLKN